MSRIALPAPALLPQASKALNLRGLTSASSCGESCFEGNPGTAAEPLRCAERWRLNTNPRGSIRPTYVIRELLWRSARVIWQIVLSVSQRCDQNGM